MAGDGMSAGLVTLGPCAHRQLHLHNASDEWLYVITAAEPLVSVTTLPNNTAVRAALAPGDAVLPPRVAALPAQPLVHAAGHVLCGLPRAKLGDVPRAEPGRGAGGVPRVSV
jgi:uncharacterized RmlC-like cupin family protein